MYPQVLYHWITHQISIHSFSLLATPFAENSLSFSAPGKAVIPQGLYQMSPSLWSPPWLLSLLLVLTTLYPKYWFIRVTFSLGHKIPFSLFILPTHPSPPTESLTCITPSMNVWCINEDAKIGRRYQKGNEEARKTSIAHFPNMCGICLGTASA